jgi:putative mycofactocin binding protein MftB
MPPVPTTTSTPPTAAYDAARAWTLHPQVALRPETFGALAYHFGTRRLTFLKSRTLLTVVSTLADHPSGSDACRAAGVPDAELGAYDAALSALADSGMICERAA